MKSLPGTAKRWVAVIAVFGVTACASMMKNHGGIHFGEHRVEISPKAQLSSKDCISLNDIVKKYDKRIYKIQSFENGRVVRVHGNLSEKYMRKGFAAEVMKQAQTMNFTGCALQGGIYYGGSSTHKLLEQEESASGSSTHPTPMPEGSASGSSTHPTPMPEGSASGSSTHPTPMPEGSASGSSTHPTPMPEGASSSTYPVDHGRHSSTLLIKESDKLVEELRPVLEKYNKK